MSEGRATVSQGCARELRLPSPLEKHLESVEAHSHTTVSLHPSHAMPCQKSELGQQCDLACFRGGEKQTIMWKGGEVNCWGCTKRQKQQSNMSDSNLE